MTGLEDPKAAAADAKVKEDRVREFLHQRGLGALVIGRRDNFAWITTGGDSRVVSSDAMGFGYFVITKNHKWLVAHLMDGRRLIDEQIPQKDVELVTLHWYQGSPVEKVLELTAGMKLAADFDLPGAAVVGPDLVDLHYPLTDLEMARYEWVGRETDRIISKIAAELAPGVTEQETAARFLYEFTRSEMLVDVLIVGFDDRIARYRHPMPGRSRLRRYALLHPAASRWGLHANVTRLVHFGEPPKAIRQASDATMRIAAEVLTRIAVGVKFADILSHQKRLYRECGVPLEWQCHFQGGITGYTLCDPARCLNPEARVVNRQAFDYFITVTGAKFEELTLLSGNGARIASLGSGWPERRVEAEKGPVAVPDVMVR